MLDDLSLFVTIMESGSLHAAAAREGLPPATVTRRLQKLEQALGYKLLHRSARRTQPTAEGQQYYEQCRALVHGLRQATQRLDASLGAIAGNIRVLAPVNFASGVLAPAWAGFLQRYPEISLDLELSNAVQDLVGSGADMAIRIGALDDSNLTQRRLGSVAMVLAAAPDYVARYGAPANPGELAAHSTIMTLPLREWRLVDPRTGAVHVLHLQPRMRVNELGLAVRMAEAGIGIVLSPRSQCDASLRAGTLVPLLPDWMPKPRDIYAVWSQERYLPARVRALLEHLLAFTRENSLLQD
jgi:LysR family transcriptional regulator AphB